jgi:hypothetical protein
MMPGRAALRLVPALVLAMAVAPVHAQLTMEIVYDASGSMWAQIEGKHRFQVLNKALESFLTKVPDSVSLALRVYGGSQKSSCEDTQLVVPFATDNRDAIKAAIRKIKPLGKTPIAASLLAAAEDLRGREGKRVIVLVSDGKETCGGDPCETARQLAERDAIKIDVVGFGIVDEATRRQLECIATVGSGSYFDAASEGDLDAGLATSVNQVAPPPPQPQIGRVTIVAERPRGAPAPGRGIAVDFYEVGNPDYPVKSFQGQNPVSVDLSAGVYRVRVRSHDLERTVDDLTLEPNAVRQLAVDFPPLEGLLLVNALGAREPLGTRVLCAALPPGVRGAEPLSEQYATLPWRLPEGNYDLRCSLLGASATSEQWLTNISVAPGERRELEVRFPMGSLAVGVLGPPDVVGTRQTFSVYAAGDHSERLAWSYVGTPVEVLAGAYDVRIEVGEGGARRVQWLEGARVRQGLVTEVSADFRPGELQLVATAGGQSAGNAAKFTVFPPGEPEAKPAGWAFSGLPLPLPAGYYDALVEFEPSAGNVQKQWVTGIEVQPGVRNTREVVFATGQLLVRIFAGGEDLGREADFSLYLPGEQARPIGKFRNHEVHTVPTGSYDVLAESHYHQYSEWRRDIVVTKDAVTELTVDFPTGRLVVNVLQGGEDLGTGATYFVYPQGQKAKHIAFAFSGSPLDLVPGNYDVRVTLGLQVQWKPQVFVEAQETVEETIEF